MNSHAFRRRCLRPLCLPFHHLRDSLQKESLVGTAGFEPTTSRFPTGRANQAALRSEFYACARGGDIVQQESCAYVPAAMDDWCGKQDLNLHGRETAGI